MRANSAALVVLVLLANAAQTQTAGPNGQTGQGRSITIKTDFSYFTNSGMKLKSFSLQFAEQKSMAGNIVMLGRIIYVLEFDQDVLNYDLEALQKAIAPPNHRLKHLFFDDDNVAMNPGPPYEHRVFGEVSGVSGEAFRIVVEFMVDPKIPVQLSRKLVVRPG